MRTPQFGFIAPPRDKYVQWFAVRCCCQPKKVLGFLPLEVGKAGPLIDTEYSFEDYRGKMHKAMMRIAGNVDLDTSQMTKEPALYSDDRPIEFWRTIPDFVEASE